MKSSKLVFVLGFLSLLCLYPKEIVEPNSVWFGYHQECLKNYYTLTWHISHGKQWTHFEGMNQPYGEHILYTDGQPLLSGMLWVLRPLYPGIGIYVPAIINLLLLLSVAWCATLLFRIFMRFNIDTRFAIPAAILLSLMAPQWLRFSCHYALGYHFFIPWLLLRTLIFYEKPDRSNSLWIALVMTIGVWLNLYFLLIGAVFLACFYLLLLINRKITFKNGLVHGSIQIFVPFALFAFWLKLTDHVLDRPPSPYGMLDYMAHWEGVFLPMAYPHGHWLKGNVGIRPLSFEALSYVGAPAVIFFIVWLFTRPFAFRQRHAAKALSGIDYMFIATLMAFIIAATLPYLLEIPQIAAIAGPLLQFRSLGRLSWLLFFGLNSYFVYYLGKAWNRRGIKPLSMLVLIIWALEALSFHYILREKIGFERKDIAVSAEHLAMKDSAVIVPLPYFHIGSEGLNVIPLDSTMAEALMEFSMATGMPTTGVMMSRTSLSQTIAQIERSQNLSGPLMTDATAKDWLLFYNRDQLENPAYRQLIDYARPLPNFGNWSTAIISAEKVLDARQNFADSLRKKALSLDSLKAIAGHYSGFDKSTVKGLVGKAVLVPLTKSYVLASGTTKDTGDYVISFWANISYEMLNDYQIHFKSGNETRTFYANQNWKQVAQGFARVQFNISMPEKMDWELSIDAGAAKKLVPLIIDELIVIKGFGIPDYINQQKLISPILVEQ